MPDRSETPSCVVVIPTYDERENIETLVAKVLNELPFTRILIVDDNSPDGTGQIADDLAANDPERIFVLHRTEKKGLGAAYVAGFTHALERWPEAQYFIQMDADLSHDPTYLGPLLDAAHEVDLAVGSRYTHGVSIVNWPLRRLIISAAGTTFARIVTGLPITDCTGGYKCYRAAALRAIDLPSIRSNGYCFQIETSFRVWQRGLTLRDVPIVFYERQRGRSKLNMSIAIEAFIIVLRLGVYRILHRRAALNRA